MTPFGEAHLHVVLEEPVGDFGEVGGLPHSIHTHEDDGVGFPLGPGRLDLPHDVYGATRRQDAGQRILYRVPHSAADPGEALQPLTH